MVVGFHLFDDEGYSFERCLCLHDSDSIDFLYIGKDVIMIYADPGESDGSRSMGPTFDLYLILRNQLYFVVRVE